MSTAPKIPRPTPTRKPRARALPVVAPSKRQARNAPLALVPQAPHGIKATLEIDAAEARALDAFIFREHVEFVHTWTPPDAAHAGDELDSVLRDVPISARATLLLLHAARAAACDGNASLARILWALHQSSVRGDLAWLTEGKAPPLAHAETFLAERFHAGSWERAAFATSRPPDRVALYNELARYFVRQPVDVEWVVPHVAFTLRYRRAELVLGPPGASWTALRERLLEQLTKVARRSDDKQRTPHLFVQAILRAWGLTARRAVDETRSME